MYDLSLYFYERRRPTIFNLLVEFIIDSSLKKVRLKVFENNSNAHSVIRLFHLSGADLLQRHAVGFISEDDPVDDLEEQSRRPQPDTESEDEDMATIHGECEMKNENEFNCM